MKFICHYGNNQWDVIPQNASQKYDVYKTVASFFIEKYNFHAHATDYVLVLYNMYKLCRNANIVSFSISSSFAFFTHFIVVEWIRPFYVLGRDKKIHVSPSCRDEEIEGHFFCEIQSLYSLQVFLLIYVSHNVVPKMSYHSGYKKCMHSASFYEFTTFLKYLFMRKSAGLFIFQAMEMVIVLNVLLCTWVGNR